MKKIFFVSLLLLASIAISAKSVPPGYVDLGLPSGTLWKTQNEPGYYTYYGAEYSFGEKLPEADQFSELSYTCSWELTQTGFRVTGPNGNQLFFPFLGYKNCNGILESNGVLAYFWVQGGWVYEMYEGNRSVSIQAECWATSIRLVISGE